MTGRSTILGPRRSPDDGPETISASVAEPLIAKLAHFGALDEGDRRALAQMTADAVWVPEGRSLIPEGQAIDVVCALLEGWACRCKDFRDGRRQIIAILTPGDLIALDDRVATRKIDHSVRALTRVRVAWIPRAELRDALAAHQGLARAISAAAAIEEAILRAWLVNLGQRSAHERMAFLFCELAERLADDAGPAIRFALPLTQQMLAHALGLTPVHINRVLRRLRREGLLELQDGVLTIHDPVRTKFLADFNNAYLRT
jgi:CRP-like cAMP-binding protein